MLPRLDEDGFLPAGIHDCALSELKQRFGSFQGSDHRPRLFASLESFVSEITAIIPGACVFVDGSFVTAKAIPNDVDLVIALRSGHDFGRDLAPSEYNVLSKVRVRRRFGFDILVATADSEEFRRYVWFFQQIRFEPGRSKGIVRLIV